MDKYKLKVQTDTVILPHNVQNENGEEQCLVTVSLNVGLFEDEDGLPFKEWVKHGGFFLCPWKWWEEGEPQFKLYSCWDRRMRNPLELDTQCGVEIDPGLKGRLAKLLNGRFDVLSKTPPEPQKSPADNFAYVDNGANSTDVVWPHGQEFLARQATPIPHALNLAFAFVVAKEDVYSRGKEGNTWYGVVAAPEVTQVGNKPWFLPGQEDVDDILDNLPATVAARHMNVSLAGDNKAGLYACQIAPSIDEMLNMEGGRLIDCATLFSRRRPADDLEPGKNSWRTDDWHAAGDAHITSRSSILAVGANVFAVAADQIAKAGKISDAKRTLIQEKLTILGKAIVFDLAAFVESKEARHTLWNWLSVTETFKDEEEALSRILPLVKSAAEATLDSGSAVDPWSVLIEELGGAPAFPAFEAWRKGAETAKQPLQEAGADLLRLADKANSSAGVKAIYDRILSAAAVEAERIDVDLKKKIDRYRAEPDFSVGLYDALVQGRTRAPGFDDQSLIAIGNQGSAEGRQADEASKAIERMRNVASALVKRAYNRDFARPGNKIDPAFKKGLEALQKQFVDEYLEADEEAGKSNAIAGGPPSIVIPIDQAGAVNAAEENITENFDLQALFNGYGLLVQQDKDNQTQENKDWRLVNAADIYLTNLKTGKSEKLLSRALVPLAVSYRSVVERKQNSEDEILLRRPVATYTEMPELPIGDPEEELKVLREEDPVTSKILGFSLHPFMAAGAKLPPLSANFNGKLSAWWIGPCGILPPALRDSEKPLKPKDIELGNKVVLSELTSDFWHDVEIRRRTPVGEPILTFNAEEAGATEKISTVEAKTRVKEIMTRPEGVKPLWDDLLPILSDQERRLVAETPRILLSPTGGDWIENQVRDKVEFYLAPPRLSFSDWKFWMFAEASGGAAGAREFYMRRLQWAQLIYLTFGRNYATSNTNKSELLFNDPAVWQPNKPFNDTSKKTWTAGFKASLLWRIRPLIVTPVSNGTSQARYTCSIGDHIAEGTSVVSKTGHYPEFPASTIDPKKLEEKCEKQLREEIGGLQSVVIKRTSDETPSVALTPDKKITVTLPPLSKAQKEGQSYSGVYLVEFAWKTGRNMKPDWFYPPVRPVNNLGPMRRFLVEVAPDVEDVKLPGEEDLWAGINVAKDDRIPKVLQASVQPPSGQPLYNDPWAWVGDIGATWQSWSWDGAPLSHSPFEKKSDPDKAILIEGKNPDVGEPGWRWEELAFENRGLAGVTLPERPFSLVAGNTKIGPISRERSEAADYIRVRAKAGWRYNALLKTSARKYVSSKRPEIENKGIQSHMEPWRGFAVRAEISTPSPAPKVRWIIPSFAWYGDAPSDTGALLMMLEESAFSSTTGHNLAEDYEVEVMSYTPPGVSDENKYSFPVIGDDPILSEKAWSGQDPENLFDAAVRFQVDPLKNIIGQTLHPDAASHVISSSILVLPPSVELQLKPPEEKSEEVETKDDKNEVSLRPFTFVRMRVRRKPYSGAVVRTNLILEKTLKDEKESGIDLLDNQPEKMWSEPFWTQLPANLEQLRRKDENGFVAVNKLRLSPCEDSLIIPNGAWQPLAAPGRYQRYVVALSFVGVEAGGRTRATVFRELQLLDCDTGELSKFELPLSEESIQMESQEVQANICLVQLNPGYFKEATHQADVVDNFLRENLRPMDIFGVQEEDIFSEKYRPAKARVLGISTAILQGK